MNTLDDWLRNASPDVRELNESLRQPLTAARQPAPAVRQPSPLEEETAFLLDNAGIVYQREYRFHPERKWQFDFALPERKIALEVEGGIWSSGRHTRGGGFDADCEKYNAAAMMGWRVLRITSVMLADGRVHEVIEWCALAE